MWTGCSKSRWGPWRWSEGWKPGTSWPEMLWMPHSWKCLRTSWRGLWACWPSGRYPCPWEGIGMVWSSHFLPTQAILWLYDNSPSFPKWKYRKKTDTLPQPPFQVILRTLQRAKYWRATVVFHFTERKRHKKMVQENSILQIMLRAGPGDLVQNTEKLFIFQDEKEIEMDTLIPECYYSVMPSVLWHYGVNMHYWTKFVHRLENKSLYSNSCGFATRPLRDHVRHSSALSNSTIHLSWCLS